MKATLLGSSLLLSFFLLSACGSTKEKLTSETPKTLSVFIFDLETLSEAKILPAEKLIAESTSGCPDLVVLQNVGEMSLLRQLQSYMSCDYPFSTLSHRSSPATSPQALFSKFEIKSVTTHPVSLKDVQGILDVQLRVGGMEVRLLALQLSESKHSPNQRKEALAYVENLFFQSKVATILAGYWETPSNLKKNFEISDDLLHASPGQNGSFFDEASKRWRYQSKLAFSRNRFSDLHCQIINFLPGQRQASDASPKGHFRHFPLLCRAAL